MGYSTDFTGQFDLDKPLTEKHHAALMDFSVIRHDDDPTMPGAWCQWVPTADSTGIEWDGGEKFYSYVEWLRYLVDHFLAPWGYTLSGEVEWLGEDPDDRGRIVVEANRVRTQHAVITWVDDGPVDNEGAAV